MTDSLEKLERNAFRSYWDDGLLDLLAGLCLVAIGASWWKDAAVLGAVFPAVAFSMWYPLRKRLIEPRLGYVEFSGKRELKARSFKQGMTSFLSGTTLLGLAVFYYWNSGQFPELREFVPGVPATILALMAFPFGIFTGCRRYFVYAAALIAAALVTVFMHTRPGPPIFGAGVAVTVSGLALMIRFFNSHRADPGVTG